MSDIVERLRNIRDPLRCFGTMEEAADEIERLQAALIQVREVCYDSAMPPNCDLALALTSVRKVANRALEPTPGRKTG